MADPKKHSATKKAEKSIEEEEEKKVPKIHLTEASLNKEVLSTFSKSGLINLILTNKEKLLETHKPISATGRKNAKKKEKELDFSKYKQIHLAFKIGYIGKNYQVNLQAHKIYK
jgi:hypothetical protein